LPLFGQFTSNVQVRDEGCIEPRDEAEDEEENTDDEDSRVV